MRWSSQRRMENLPWVGVNASRRTGSVSERRSHSVRKKGHTEDRLMAIVVKSLAETQLTANASMATYNYTPPPGQATVIRSIRLGNPDSVVPARVYVWCWVGSVARDSTRFILRFFVQPPVPHNVAPPSRIIQPKALYVVPGEVTLGQGDLVQVVLQSATSDTARLDIVISGIERAA